MSVIRKPFRAPSPAPINGDAVPAPPFRHIGEVVGVVIDNTMRAPTSEELAELREAWWRWRREGVPLPAETGVIVFESQPEKVFPLPDPGSMT